jgi:hypothetical protein
MLSTVERAMAFVREHGVVLVSANGPVPKVTESIARGPIKGSWWGHPKSHEIFRTLELLRGSPEILVCRLVDGKLTLVHRRLWPALVRVAHHFPGKRIAQVHETHTSGGHHVTRDVQFPDWVPPDVAEEASALEEDSAFRALGAWVMQKSSVRKPRARK